MTIDTAEGGTEGRTEAAEQADPRRCGARTRRGVPCRNWPIQSRGRCRLHGGRSLLAWASPTFKHGGYSKYTVRRFRRAPARAEPDPTARSDTLVGAQSLNTPCIPSNPMNGSEVGESGDATGVTPDDANADAASRRRRRRAPEQGPSPEQVGLAAALCYRDAESDEQIARRLGIARRTLARWKRRPDFAAAAVALVTFQGWELSRGRKHPEKI